MEPVNLHCETCRCYERPIPEPVTVGQWIRNRLTGEIRQVQSIAMPNMPWHEGGTPFVVGRDGGLYWHYYDAVDGMDF